MTDEHQNEETPSEPTPPPGMTPGDHDDAAVLEGAGEVFTTGEGLVAFAGMVILADWVIFRMIANTYSMSTVIVVLAALAILLPRLDRDRIENFHPLPALMKIIGWGLVMFGIVELLLDIRIGIYDDFGTVIAALISYGGYVVAFMGARQIEV